MNPNPHDDWSRNQDEILIPSKNGFVVITGKNLRGDPEKSTAANQSKAYAINPKNPTMVYVSHLLFTIIGLLLILMSTGMTGILVLAAFGGMQYYLIKRIYAKRGKRADIPQ
mgnify:CR=1 FL=1